MDQATEQRIRQRAYELWLAADKPEGSHLRFWSEAEAELVEGKAASPSATQLPTAGASS